MAHGTERPTRRRIERAIREGDVAVSRTLSHSAALLAVIAMAPAAVRAIASRFEDLFDRSIHGSERLAAADLVREVLVLSVPVVLAATAISWLSSMLQVGRIGLVPLHAGSRSSPMRLRLWDAVRGSIAIALVGGTALVTLADSAAPTAVIAGRVQGAAVLAPTLALRVAWIASLGFALIGIVDFIVLRADRLARLKMTRDEMRREQREREGDPEIRRARRHTHEELSRELPLEAVEQARLVVWDGFGTAVAIGFDSARDIAPVVLASGTGARARAVTRIAASRHIPIVTDRALARPLARIVEGEPIPPALYDAVASVFRIAGISS